MRGKIQSGSLTVPLVAFLAAAAGAFAFTALQGGPAVAQGGHLVGKAPAAASPELIFSKKKKKVRRGSHSTTSTSTTGPTTVGK